MPRHVVFDSSFLISVIENPTTWYEDITESVGAFTPVVLDTTMTELERLANRKRSGKGGRYAALAAELGSSFELVHGGETGVSADDNILSWAAENDAYVATVDGEMLGHLRARGMRHVTLRGRRVYVW